MEALKWQGRQPAGCFAMTILMIAHCLPGERFARMVSSFIWLLLQVPFVSHVLPC